MVGPAVDHGRTSSPSRCIALHGIPVDLVRSLAQRFDLALVATFGIEGVDPLLRRSDHADYQSNVALSLKGRVAGNPRELAGKIVAAAKLDDLCEEVTIAGPGFINLRLRSEVIAQGIASLASSATLGIEAARDPDVCVIDYSSPNVAKEMHVGHLRSTILGDALAQVLEALGHRVVRQNHLGDWGTQFGMLIEHLVDLANEGEDAAVADSNVRDLNEFYRAARAKFDASAEFAERARARVVLLQAGDPATLSHWRRLVEVSSRYLASVYARLGVTLHGDDIAGESLYNARLEPIVDELVARGLARVDDGALCVFLAGIDVPLIVRKKDGGYGYATTDLAAIRHRVEKLGGTRLLYVVGSPQRQHLSMVFETAKLAGWLAPPVRAEHVAFGSVLGKDGKMFKTRAGETVRLLDLLNEAEQRALVLVKEKSPHLGDEEQRAVARAVGIGAIKYADLSSDRIKDYVFDWDRMLSTDGNSAPYLQYVHARSRSILRKAEGESIDPNAARIECAEERALALSLVTFASVVGDVGRTLEPHRLCNYLYELATIFNTFWTKCPVLKAEGTTRAARLLLCDLTARTIASGADLLGIETPQRM